MARRRTTTDADAAVEPLDSNVAETGTPVESASEVTPKPRRTRKAPAIALTDASPTDVSPVSEAKGDQPAPKPRRTRAKSADAVVVSDEQSGANVQATDEPAAPARQTRTRRTTKAVVEEVAPTATAEPIVEDAIASQAGDSSRPQRTRGRRRPIENATVVEVPVVTNTGDPVDVDEADEKNDDSLDGSEVTRSRNQRTRRGRGRRGRGGDAVADAGQDTEIAAGEPDDSGTDEASNEPASRSARSRRGRGRRGRTGEQETTEAATVTESSDVTGGESDSDDDDGRGDRRRGRGLRRTRTVAAPQLMLGGDASSETSESDPDEAVAPARRSQRSANLPPAIPLLVPIPEDPLPPVFAPLSADLLERFSASSVRLVNGRPVLHVNSEARPAIMFFVNTEGDFDRSVAQRQIRYAYQAGVRVFTMLAHLPWRTSADERNYSHLEDMLQFVADIAPDAMILPRLIFSPPSGWVRRNPDDMAIGVDGPTGDVSLGS
ncbi:MAG: hypothetical protein ACKO14_10905, partial [Armatimonadota bacterium]